jgi:hypothetical protein
VAWWAWLLVGWLVLSVVCGLFIGALAATARERERGTAPDGRSIDRS